MLEKSLKAYELSALKPYKHRFLEFLTGQPLFNFNSANTRFDPQLAVIFKQSYELFTVLTQDIYGRQKRIHKSAAVSQVEIFAEYGSAL